MDIFPETEVIVFPELSFTWYVLDDSNKELWEDTDWFCISETKKLAEKYNVNIIAWFIEKNGLDKPYNSSMVISKDWKLICTYQKSHLFSQSKEPELYSAWKKLQTFEIWGWRCGIFICFDCRYPRLFEAYKEKWVECIFWLYNWVWWRNKPEIFNSILKTRATENQYFLAGIDCSWSDENANYTSSACITTPYCEDIKITKKEIYHYAELKKQDIEEVSSLLPLKPSFKEDYLF
jgi:predicted amidohydrolase